MNERIRELSLQANGPNPFYGTLKNQMTLLGDDAVEKFALLIVKECISVPYDMWDKAELNADVAVKIEHRIKEHFGVEL